MNTIPLYNTESAPETVVTPEEAGHLLGITSGQVRRVFGRKTITINDLYEYDQAHPNRLTRRHKAGEPKLYHVWLMPEDADALSQEGYRVVNPRHKQRQYQTRRRERAIVNLLQKQKD